MLTRPFGASLSKVTANHWGVAAAISAASIIAVACGSNDDGSNNGVPSGPGGSSGAGGAVAGVGGTSNPGAGGGPNSAGGIVGSGGTAPTGSGGAGGTPVPGGGGASSGGTTPTGTGGVDPGTGGTTAGKPYVDPGTAPWVEVPKADVGTVCKLDAAKLTAAETAFNHPWAIFRYGKLCWEHDAKTFPASEAYSTTKTLGALVAGMVAYQTKDIPRTGKKTGAFSDEDDALQWLDSVSYNKAAKVGHVMGMVAHDASLAYGSKSFAYDTIGATEINSISDMLNNAIAQDKTRLGNDLEGFTKKFLYAPLGMTKSVWSGGAVKKTFAYTWSTDLLDMARVGQLILDYGMWSGQRLVAEEWIYRMTHPSFEDANTGFGYLTWLNSSSNWTSISGGKQQGAHTPGTCAPVALHKTYPHGISEAKDCGYSAPYTCTQKYDVGVWQAEGLGGQLIQGHRGLDMVIVARNAQPGGTGPGTAFDVWTALKGAVIAGDPMYKGDETAFCKDYGSNNYAPDMH